MRGFIHGAPAGSATSSGTRSMPATWRTMSRVICPEDRPLAREVLSHAPGADRAEACEAAQPDHPRRHSSLQHPHGRRCNDHRPHRLRRPRACAAGAGSVPTPSADFLFPGRDHAATIYEMVRGYCRAAPLEEAEAERDPRHDRGAPADDAADRSLKASMGISPQGYFGPSTAAAMPLIRELRAIGRDRLHATDPPRGRLPPGSSSAAIRR